MLPWTLLCCFYLTFVYAFDIDLFRTYLCKHPQSTYEVGLNPNAITDMMAKSKTGKKDDKKSKNAPKKKK